MPTDKSNVVGKFLKFSPSQQTRILRELKLIDREGDKKRDIVTLLVLAFARARKEGLMPQLISDIEKEAK